MKRRIEDREQRRDPAGMYEVPPFIDQLHGELCRLPDPGMLINDLDGLLSGVLVCPDTIAQDEWLPLVWGMESAPFETREDADRVIGLVMRHYNWLADCLRRGIFAPLIDEDEVTGEIMWELWIDGFDMALDLHRESWAKVYAGDDDDAKDALALLTMLADVNRGDYEPPEQERERLNEGAPLLIAASVASLYRTKTGSVAARGTGARRARARIGRNEPCPCGSGKKYKRCCGAS